MILTDTCRPAVSRALQAHPGILLVGRSAAPSAGGVDAAVSGVFAAADSMARREGIDVRHLLPADPAVLTLHHRTNGQVGRYPAPTGIRSCCAGRCGRRPGSALTVLLVTGSGTRIDIDTLDQPSVERVAQLVQQAGPSVVYARSLSRFGRGYPAALFEVLQTIAATRADGPFLGDSTIPLAEPDLGVRMRIALAVESHAAQQPWARQPRHADGRWASRRPATSGGPR